MNWVDSECIRIKCAIFFQSSSTIHYRWNWRMEGNSPFHTSTLCNAILTTEKSTPTIQNAKRTHGTIHPSILFFPFLLHKSNFLLSFQSTACSSMLSNHHFTPFTPFHTNSIVTPFYIHSTSLQTTRIAIHRQPPHRSLTHYVNNPISQQQSQPF